MATAVRWLLLGAAVAGAGVLLHRLSVPSAYLFAALLVGLVVALAAVTALTRACDVVVPDPLRVPVPRVLPVRFDAGVSQ